MKHTTRLLLAILTLTACADSAAPPGLAGTADATFAAARSLSTGVTTLPTFGGASAEARAINDAGTVVGYASETNSSRTTAAVTYAARWVRNAGGGWEVPTRLGAAGGRALALNDSGDAVGTRHGSAALVWPAAGGEITLPKGAVAEGINNAGIIVGGTTWPNNGVALVWIPDVGTTSSWTSDPHPLEGGTFSHASAINEDSVITGFAVSAAGREQAVVWLPKEGGGWSSSVLLSGTAGSLGSSGGFGINAAGDVVGYYSSCPGCGFRASYWPATGPRVDLSPLYSNTGASHAHGIADDQRLVGHFAARRGTNPFLWQPFNTALTDLGTGEANDINNRTARYGQEVVGFRPGSKGSRQATVWRAP